MPRKRRESKRLVPVIQESGIWHAIGSVAGQRIRQSLRTRDEGTAKEQCALLEARLWKRHNYGDAAIRTFEEAALSYQEQGGKTGDGGDGTFLAPLIRHFKGRALSSITSEDIRAAAVALYPKGAPATRNRQGIVPARAVMLHGHRRGWCGAIKVTQFEVPKSRKHKPVDRAWLDAFMAEADRREMPHLSAIVLFMNQTGARVSEAVRLTGEWVDLGQRIAILEKTKTDEHSVRHLTAELVARIAALRPREGKPVFFYTDRSAVTRIMKKLAADIGLPVRSSHGAGRHSFGTNAYRETKDAKQAMDAGGWKSAKLFMETYVHSKEAGATVAKLFDAQTGPIDTNKASSKVGRLNRFGRRAG